MVSPLISKGIIGNELLLFQKATSLVLGGWLEINYSLARFITGFGMLDL